MAWRKASAATAAPSTPPGSFCARNPAANGTSTATLKTATMCTAARSGGRSPRFWNGKEEHPHDAGGKACPAPAPAGTECRRTRIPEPKRLFQAAERFGAAEALSGLFSRGRLSDCFDALADAGHLELSPEALVVSKEFGPLFSDEEADFCLQALLQAGFYG